jgi:hypothetical protein
MFIIAILQIAWGEKKVARDLGVQWGSFTLYEFESEIFSKKNLYNNTACVYASFF